MTTKLTPQVRTVLAALCSLVLGGTVVTECSSDGKLRIEPRPPAQEQAA